MTPEQIEAEIALTKAGYENLPKVAMNTIGFALFFTYFIAIFIYVRKRNQYFKDNYSDSDYLNVRWTIKFLVSFFIIFCVVVAAIIINPRTDSWLCPILNSAGMAYLVYIVVFHSTAPFIKFARCARR